MKTKLFSFTLIFALATSMAFTQSSENSRISFGILGGVNMQNLNGKSTTGDKLENTMIIGYHAGVNVQIPIVPQFYFQPGLMFSTKGAESNIDLFSSTILTSTYKLSYIELPLNFVYKAEVGNGYFMLGFGPYIAYGIGGKAKFNINNTSTEDNIIFANEYSSIISSDWKYFKHLDYGGNIFFGYELNNGLSIQLNAQLGLAKINADNTAASSKSEFRNTGFGLSLGYNF